MYRTNGECIEQRINRMMNREEVKMDWIEYLGEVNTASILLRLTLICIFSGIIGIERGTKRRPAGFRTYMLVGMGSTLVMITSQYMTDIRHIAGDASRMSAQVVSGIGFLGAGTIITVGRNKVKGLTTAAGLWACACMGLAVGIGFYQAAIIGGIYIFFIMMGLHRIDEYIQKHGKVLELYVELDDIKSLTYFIEEVKKHKTQVSNLEIHRMKQEGQESVSALMTLKLEKYVDHTSYILRLHEVSGIRSVEEII